MLLWIVCVCVEGKIAQHQRNDDRTCNVLIELPLTLWLKMWRMK